MGARDWGYAPGDSGYEYDEPDEPTPEEIEQAKREEQDHLWRFGPPRRPTPEELAEEPPY